MELLCLRQAARVVADALVTVSRVIVKAESLMLLFLHSSVRQTRGCRRGLAFLRELEGLAESELWESELVLVLWHTELDG
jgi:hypothetical protein